jgi:hypothetical protein
MDEEDLITSDESRTIDVRREDGVSEGISIKQQRHVAGG